MTDLLLLRCVAVASDSQETGYGFTRQSKIDGILARRASRLERNVGPRREPRVTVAFVTTDGRRTHAQIDDGPFRSDPEALALPLPTEGACKVWIGISPDDL
jgi:hypothetical protein